MACTEDESIEPRSEEGDAAVPRSSDRIWLEVSILASDTERAPDHRTREDARQPVVAIIARGAELRAYIRDCIGGEFRTIEAADLALAAGAMKAPPDLLILGVCDEMTRDAELLPLSVFGRVRFLLITDEPHHSPLELHGRRPVAVIAQPFNARRLRDEVRRWIKVGTTPRTGAAP